MYYTLDRLTIERLSGEILPMDKCYINLILIGQNVKHPDHCGGSDGIPPLKSSPFSLDVRLEVDTPHTDFLITLPTLFDHCQIPDGDMQQPKSARLHYARKLFIISLAGISGKICSIA
jgi:hypothetical protein